MDTRTLQQFSNFPIVIKNCDKVAFDDHGTKKTLLRFEEVVDYRGIAQGQPRLLRSYWRGKLLSRRSLTPSSQTAAVSPTARDTKSLAGRALEHYMKSKQFLRQENWTRYGEELKKMEELLRQLQEGR